MRCIKLTTAGGCAETADRVPCTARLCAVKNEARADHTANLKRIGNHQQRGEYIEWHERRHGPALGSE